MKVSVARDRIAKLEVANAPIGEGGVEESPSTSADPSKFVWNGANNSWTKPAIMRRRYKGSCKRQAMGSAVLVDRRTSTLNEDFVPGCDDDIFRCRSRGVRIREASHLGPVHRLRRSVRRTSATSMRFLPSRGHRSRSPSSVVRCDGGVAREAPQVGARKFFSVRSGCLRRVVNMSTRFK